MKCTIALVAFLTVRTVSLAQGEIQKQINDQVWNPFVASFENNDRRIMEQIYSREFVRIELRFIERIASPENAFEVGYYKTTSVNRITGISRVSYGKFHVLLRMEEGKWKILMDEDAHDNTNEQVFLSGRPM